MGKLRSSHLGTLLGFAVTLGIGCSGHVSRGHALYSEGYYVEAAEVFERNERRLSEWPPDKRATYGLYRGLTLLQLGDLQGAARWLAYARWVASEHPGALGSQEVALLDQSQHTLDLRLGRTGADSPAPVLLTTATPSGAPPLAPAPAKTAPPAPAPSRKSFSD